VDKFGRIYSLSIEGESLAPDTLPWIKSAFTQAFEIKNPITLQFSVVRSGSGANQEASFRIYNLSQKTRDALQRDYFQTDVFRAIQFRAGYESPDDTQMPIVFNGQIRHAYSYREGVDWITEIAAFDMGITALTTYVNETASAGQSHHALLKTLAGKFRGASAPPVVGSFPETTKRATVLTGNLMDIIRSYVGRKVISDNGQVKILNDDEYLDGPALTIDAGSGLLGTPRRAEAIMTVKTLFEPRAVLWGMVSIKSETMPRYNGSYKVLAIKHEGTISGAVAGECTTTLSLLFTQKKLNPVK